MQLTNVAVSEFQAVYKQVFGSEIAADVAENMGLSLLRIFQLIYRQVPAIDTDKLAMYTSRSAVYK